MNQFFLIAADLVAVSILVGMYFARHRRRYLVVALLTVNVGVLAVAVSLGGSAVGVGLGLGLFGVLSIIRPRSSEIAQHEVAYYLGALVAGHIGARRGRRTLGRSVVDRGHAHHTGGRQLPRPASAWSATGPHPSH